MKTREFASAGSRTGNQRDWNCKKDSKCHCHIEDGGGYVIEHRVAPDDSLQRNKDCHLTAWKWITDLENL